ncbi:hypothetical protein GJ496_006191 [Pomphorhynchus laevis]|nr:hypothetical protein GJ496_006191 [Pomphorhynchus laevis]
MPREFGRWQLLDNIRRTCINCFNDQKVKPARLQAINKMGNIPKHLHDALQRLQLISNSVVKPHSWMRYIDDVFCIWDGSEDAMQSFLKQLNDGQMKFTCNLDCPVNFLDVTIEKLISRAEVLSAQPERPKKAACVTTYHPALASLSRRMVEAFKMCKTHGKQPIVYFKTHQTLKNMLVRSKFNMSEESGELRDEQHNKCAQCKRARCKCCALINEIKTFHSNETKLEY